MHSTEHGGLSAEGKKLDVQTCQGVDIKNTKRRKIQGATIPGQTGSYCKDEISLVARFFTNPHWMVLFWKSFFCSLDPF